MVARTHSLRRKSLAMLKVLLKEYPSEVPDFTPENLNLPVALAAQWKSADPKDLATNLRYPRVPFSTYKYYADALGAGVELVQSLESQHVISSAILVRKIFENLVTVSYVLSAGNAMLDHAARISEIPVDEYSQYLRFVETHPQSIFARQVAFTARELAAAEWTADMRIIWNKFCQDNSGFVNQAGFRPFNLQDDAGMPDAKKVTLLTKRRTPWTKTEKYWTMCKAIDKSSNARIVLSGDKYPTTYCEEYVVCYAVCSQLVHAGPSEKKVFDRSNARKWKLRARVLPKYFLHLLAYWGALYLGELTWQIAEFTKTSLGERLLSELESLKNLREILPQMLRFDVPME